MNVCLYFIFFPFMSSFLLCLNLIGLISSNHYKIFLSIVYLFKKKFFLVFNPVFLFLFLFKLKLFFFYFLFSFELEFTFFFFVSIAKSYEPAHMCKISLRMNINHNFPN